MAYSVPACGQLRLGNSKAAGHIVVDLQWWSLTHCIKLETQCNICTLYNIYNNASGISYLYQNIQGVAPFKVRIRWKGCEIKGVTKKWLWW